MANYGRAVWREAETQGHSAGARLAIVVLQKRALSSARALVRSVTRRLEWLDGLAPPAAAQLLLPLGDEAPDNADAEPDTILAVPGLADAGRERAWLRAIQQSALRASAGETKLAALRRLVRRVEEPLIVFTEYRDTLAMLADVLGGPPHVVVLHGAQTRDERRATERAFTGGAAQILLATDAASEGLNLHRRCRLVIDYELPWTPRRLEQRVGRVDRLGQDRRVHAIHFMAAGTAEADVLGRLAARVEQVRRTLGRADGILGLTAEAIAEAAIAGFASKLPVLEE
jgi:superfamily II DNA or RNA helicase